MMLSVSNTSSSGGLDDPKNRMTPGLVSCDLLRPKVIFIQQGGRNRHEHICQSLELFAEKVMPEFKARHDEQERKKNDELAPYIEQALARKKWMKPLEDSEIPVLEALGRQIVQQLPEDQKTAEFGRDGGVSVPLRDPVDG